MALHDVWSRNLIIDSFRLIIDFMSLLPCVYAHIELALYCCIIFAVQIIAQAQCGGRDWAVPIRMATSCEAGPSLEEILSRHGLKEADLNRECPRDVRDEVAVKLDNWEMFGRCLEFDMEKLRDIDRENRTQDLCKVALLDTWYKREGKEATYLKLIRVLYRRNRRDLVEFLCEKIMHSQPLTMPINSLEMPQTHIVVSSSEGL